MTSRALEVLLVEDDPEVGVATVELLQCLGHDARLAASSKTALAALAEPNDIALVLLDLQLGEARGEAMVEQLRQVGRALPPIVILSGEPSSVTERAARRVGACGVLHKPCSASNISAAIEQAVL